MWIAGCLVNLPTLTLVLETTQDHTQSWFKNQVSSDFLLVQCECVFAWGVFTQHHAGRAARVDKASHH